MEIKISVRNLVEFMLRSGNIDNRRASFSENAMQEGSRIHRMIQKRMGSNYKAEVPLRFCMTYDEYSLFVEGRADGIIQLDDNRFVIDEIKSTYRELHYIKEAAQVHLAQAKCYAYMYALEHELSSIGVRITYCNIDTEEIKYFDEQMLFDQLEYWFFQMLNNYKKWTDYEFEWNKLKIDSIKKLSFPFEYREGQKELVTYVYQTVYHKRKLFIEAPTGVGKTISTVFPCVKSVGEEKGDKLFYLTAKTITRTVAEEAFRMLREHHLLFKTVILTAKDKICCEEEVECNPIACPRANGHYDRINEAIYDLLTSQQVFSREVIEEYACKHQVCPFEMSLDMSLFADGIICDYNYVFDPHVYLKRFFGEGKKGEYIFLIDEAHNLVDRGRQMYSAILYKESFLKLKQEVKSIDTKMEKQLEHCNKELLLLKRECTTYIKNPFIDGFVMKLQRLSATMEKFLEEADDGQVRKKVLEFYFEISHFLAMYELIDDNYVVYCELDSEGSFYVRLFCVNPSNNLMECMARGRSSILFSATLLPIQYYKLLLGGREEDYEVYADSTFDPNKRGLFIGSDVTTKYTRRTEHEFDKIVKYIFNIVNQKRGNYMVFFPSHRFLQQVYEKFTSGDYDMSLIDCVIQDHIMNEKEREDFLNRFSGNEGCDLEEHIKFEILEEQEKSLIGFCVMGGLFSEGIDLKHDSLIGAIIVGTGIPQICVENEILKEYFDEKGEEGFDYAYRYPGMNKVLQSAGRVIRTQEDIGVIALLDERFLGSTYQKMFPREWEHFHITNSNNVKDIVSKFWDQWLLG